MEGLFRAKVEALLELLKKKKGGEGVNRKDCFLKSNMKQFNINTDLIRNLCIHFYYTCGRFITLISVFYYQIVLNFGLYFFQK